MYIKRDMEEKLEKLINKREFIAVVGPRQAGKTTMLTHFVKRHGGKIISFEDAEVLELFDNDIKSFAKLYVEGNKLLFIDEFQYSRNSKNLKFLFDNYSKQTKIIISGSSSARLLFENLSAMVGRIRILELFPLSFREFLRFKDPKLYSALESGYSRSLFKFIEPCFKEFLLFGGYPRVVLEEDKMETLKTILDLLVMRDFAYWKEFENSFAIKNILKLIASKPGQILNYNEIAKSMGKSIVWVKEKISFLESLYIIKRVPPFFTNKKKEVCKAPKVYFIDNGFINLIRGNPTLTGDLIENFAFSEFIKYGFEVKYWRTKSKAEVDFILNDRIPVEVKSNVASMTRAMSSFVGKYKPKKYFIAGTKGGDHFLPLVKLWMVD